MRDACDADEVRVVCVRTRACSVSRYKYKSFISMRRQFSIECKAIQMLGYTVSAANIHWEIPVRVKLKGTRRVSC